MEDEEVGFDKIAALMANFYGVSELDDEDSTDNFANSPENIDCSSFDASAYVLRSVRDDQLSDLLRADETLITEVQELNNDMQNLVYENYNKFISATDTIRKMKDQVEGMETEIETLISTMDSVGKRSEQINQKLQPKRERVENIQSLQRLIKRLEFLFELPLRLKRSIELEAYTQAVKYYNMASGILEKHSEVESFGAIQIESNEIMSTLKTHMYAHLTCDNTKTKPNVLSENVRLLIDLGESKTALSIKFLEWHGVRLQQRVHDLTTCFDAAEETAEQNDPYQVMWYANSLFLSDMNAFLESHEELFGNSNNNNNRNSTIKKKNSIEMERDGNEDEDGVAAAVEEEEEVDLSRGHHKMVHEIFGKYFRVIRSHLLRHPLPSSFRSSNKKDDNNNDSNNDSNDDDNDDNEGFQALLSALGRFKSELRESSLLLRPAKLRLGDRAAEIIENTIRTQMNRAFVSLRKTFQQRIQHMATLVEKATNTVSPNSADDIETSNSSSTSTSGGGPPSKPPSKPPTTTSFKSTNGGPPAKMAPKPSTNGNPFETAAASPTAPETSTNPFSAPEQDDTNGNPFGNVASNDQEQEEQNETKETKNTMKKLNSLSTSTEEDAHGLVTVVRSMQDVLVSDVERTLNVLQSLLRDATSNDAVHGRILSKDMVHIFVRLMRAEFDQLLIWFSSQVENCCDGVGTNRHSCEVTNNIDNETTEDHKSSSPSSPTSSSVSSASSLPPLSSSASASISSNSTASNESIVVQLFDTKTKIQFLKKSRFVLAISFLFRDFASKSIGYMLEVLTSGGVEDEDGMDDMDDMNEMDMMGRHASDNKLIKMCDRCSSTLLSQYITIKAKETVQHVYNRLESISNSSSTTEDINDIPSSIDVLAHQILQNAALIGTDASVLLGGRIPKYNTKTGSMNSIRNGPTPGNKNDASTKGKSAVSLDIDRIFAKKVTIYGNTSFSKEELLQEYFRIVFKSLGEYSRLLIFSTYGYKVCLITVRYLYDILPTYCNETESLDYLLSDWIHSANERCVQPDGLSEAEIENVVTKLK